MNRNALAIVCLVLAVILGAIMLSSCVSYQSAAPGLSLFGTEMAGYKTNMLPDSDGNVVAGSATSGIVDNPTIGAALGQALVDMGVSVAEAETALGNPEDAAALIAKLETENPEAASQFKQWLGIRARCSALLAINGNQTDYARQMQTDAIYSAAIKSAMGAAQKESQADVEATQPTDISPSLTVTPGG